MINAFVETISITLDGVAASANDCSYYNGLMDDYIYRNLENMIFLSATQTQILLQQALQGFHDIQEVQDAWFICLKGAWAFSTEILDEFFVGGSVFIRYTQGPEEVILKLTPINLKGSEKNVQEED